MLIQFKSFVLNLLLHKFYISFSSAFTKYRQIEGQMNINILFFRFAYKRVAATKKR